MRSRAQLAVMTVRIRPVTSPEFQGCPHTPSLPGASPGLPEGSYRQPPFPGRTWAPGGDVLVWP